MPLHQEHVDLLHSALTRPQVRVAEGYANNTKQPVHFAVTVVDRLRATEWIVERRYSAFDTLQRDLWWKGLAPDTGLPPKKPPPGYDLAKLRARAAGLEAWAADLLSKDASLHSPAVQKFFNLEPANVLNRRQDVVQQQQQQQQKLQSLPPPSLSPLLTTNSDGEGLVLPHTRLLMLVGGAAVAIAVVGLLMQHDTETRAVDTDAERRPSAIVAAAVLNTSVAAVRAQLSRLAPSAHRAAALALVGRERTVAVARRVGPWVGACAAGVAARAAAFNVSGHKAKAEQLVKQTVMSFNSGASAMRAQVVHGVIHSMNASSTAGRAQLSRLAPAARRGVAAVAAGRDRAAAAAAAGRDSAAAAAGRVGSWMNAYAASAALELPKQKARAKRFFDRMSEWAMRPAAAFARRLPAH